MDMQNALKALDESSKKEKEKRNPGFKSNGSLQIKGYRKS